MNIIAIRATLKISVLTAVLLLCALLLHSFGDLLSQATKVSTQTNSHQKIVIIDAGHGGEDGGAVGINGAVEKNINLAIAKQFYGLLKCFGIPVVMTREEDVMLYRDAQAGHKKTQDLKSRLEMTESYAEPILISIHMNSYPIEKYSGTQVYYSPHNPESKAVAQTIQNSVVKNLQPENKRECKAATSAIYILHNTTKPAVLVECGFLSNRNEADLLVRPEYQSKISITLLSAVIDYINEKGI